MIMLKKLINNYKAINFLMLAVMCLLSLYGTAVAIKSDTFKDSSVSLSQIANIICLVFLTLLSGYLIAKKETAGVMRFFMLFLLNVYIAVFLNLLVGSVYGMPEYTQKLTIYTDLSYFFSMSLFLTIWFYQRQFLEDTVMTRVITVFILTAVAIYTAVIILNLFHPILFLITDDGVFSNTVMDYVSIATDIACLVFLCIGTLFSSLSRIRKLSFICCIFSPVLFSVLSLNDLSITIYGILVVAVMMPVCLIFYNTNDELEKNVLRHEKEETELRVSAMISQMQPHFLYNSLAVIAALCEEDPALAAKATNTFSDYLRENISFANKSSPIPFTEELSHIKVYVWLEKLRFPKKLNIEYDIGCDTFLLPALSVQPMVENAIKHGICKTRDGGTVRISSFETDQYYTVTVSDNGTGFDISQVDSDDRQHLGIENTRYRIQEMVGGSLDIVSTQGEGTTVTINIPK